MSGDIMRLSLNLIALFGMGIGLFVLWKIFGNSIKAYMVKSKKDKDSKKLSKETKTAKPPKRSKKSKDITESEDEIQLTTIETKKEGLSLGEVRNVK